MSTTFAASGGVRLLLRWMLALWLLATSHVALAAYCPTPKSATVNSGGSVSFEVGDCDGPSNIGMTDPGVPPAHGTYSLPGQNPDSTEQVTYTNNGDGATSDSFYLLDEDNNQIVFNITVNPSRTASIAVSPASRNENSGAAFTYTVTLSQSSSSATTVNLSRGGTATSGTDYTGAPSSIVVPANATTATFSVTPVADTTVEADETVVISVASGSGYGIGSPSSATATIVNDDFPTASITVSPSSVPEDGTTNLIYTVSLDQAAQSAVSVAFSVGGSATSGTDYAAVSSPLVINAGQTTGTITINPTADATIEPDETVVISLAAGSGYSVGSPNSATGTILNDDQPALSINDVSVSEGNAGTTNATFTVSLSQPAGAGGVSFDISTADGTATAGVDYVASSLAGQTIPAGSSSATFTVQVNGDSLSEPDETFFVNVSNVTGATVADAQGLGTIVNDDAVPSLSIDDISVNEGNSGTTTATFTVSLSAASGQTVSVNYATANGTATAGSDYVARSGTLTFPPGTTAQGVAITVNGDTAVEASETFSVGLSGASNASIARATGTGTILNDDVVVIVGPATLPAATAGSAYSQNLSASGGTAPYTFAVTAGALPPGLTLSAAGVLSGTPTATGSFNFTATATDSGGSPTSGNRAYTLTVAGATVTLPATNLPAGTAGQAYSSALTPATGGIAPYTYAVTAGALPAGITLNGSSGALTGTPGTAGSFSFNVTATDSTSGTPSQATQSYSLTIAAPPIVVAPSTLPAATRGTAYSQTLSASGGTAPYTYTLASGTLPAGLTLASNGTLSGTATVEGSFNFTVTATDAGSFTGNQAYSLTVAGPNVVLPASTLPAGTAGQAYAATITPASGGTAPYSYALTGGVLPAGVVVDAATGSLSGTPTVAGTFTFTLTVSDSTPSPAAQASRSYTLTIAAPVIVVAPTTLPAATRGTAYSQTLSASGGTAPYTYTLASGTLPAGLTLASNGTLSGTATVEGSFNFTVTATDANAFTAAQAYALTVAGPNLALPASTLPAGTAGQAYAATISPATGGTAPYSYALTGGVLPAGVVVDAATGSLSGTPTVAGTFTFTLTVSDSTPSPAAQASRSYTLTIAAPVIVVAPTALPAATRGTAYSQTLSASGGTAPYTYSLGSGTLPAGLTLASNGTLSGTATVEGSFSFTVTATDANAFTAAQAYALTVAGPNLTLPASTLPAGTAGQAYAATISPATGGTAPYSYALTAGTLPNGMVLDAATGALSGTPTLSGNFAFTLTASDSTPSPAAQASRNYTLTIAAATLVPGQPTLPPAVRGRPYSQVLTASGGVAPYTYSVANGRLPAGLTLSGNGTLSGTPTAEGVFSFAIAVADAGNASTTQAYTFTVDGPNLVLPASTLPAGTAAQVYAATIAPATGGIAPYSYALTAGALPSGIVLDAATGGLSGTPTSSGTFNFTLTATDSTPSPAAQASQRYTVTIAAATLVLAQPTLPPATRGSAYTQVLTASGGVAPYRYSIASGTLPAGLTLASDGTLSGTPTTQGTSSFTIAVADAGNASATQAYSFTVSDAAPVAVADVAATMSDAAVTVAVTANDTGNIASIGIATAPTNGTAVVNGLELVYTPAAGFVGTDVVSYTVTGSGGTSAPVTVTIAVNARPVAVSVTAAAVPGEAQQVDLTRNATGGPFVAAAVVAVLPASAGTATITRTGGTATAAAARASGPSPAAAAMAETPTFMLTFTPNPAFVGQATVQFTLSNAFATSVPASVVFTIAPRRDPSVDAEVRGLIDAQSESTRRFARAQIDNFQRRLEATHRGGSTFSNAVSFQPTSHCRQADRGISAQPCSPDTQEADNDFRDAPAMASSGNSTAQGQGDLGLWVGGAIRSGSLDKQSNSNGVDFQTDGLSVGADYRVAQSLAIGAGLGWGRDDSDVGRNGSHSKATAYTMALYASFHPGKAFFFDTLVGYQLLSYDLRRFVTDDSSMAEGNRDGKQWIASVSTGADLQRGELQVTPYARVDVARATLDGYVEDGVAPFALRYDDMDVATTTGNLGLRLEWRREVAWGRLTPQLRVEYQRDFQGRGDATLSYADLNGGPFYRAGQSAFDRNRLMVGIGAALLTEQGLSTRLEYRGITDGDSNNDQTWMINLEKKY
ncbi:outer membrane autotransporter protein [Xanthomonas arboricola]|nr:outer membrane autotransporter protein [Xanthomonas euroxanthea]